MKPLNSQDNSSHKRGNYFVINRSPVRSRTVASLTFSSKKLDPKTVSTTPPKEKAFLHPPYLARRSRLFERGQPVPCLRLGAV